MTHLYVGIDIASNTFQAHWQHIKTGEVGEREFKQCRSHYQTFVNRLQSLCESENTHVVMEATGNYWLYLALALYEAEITVSVINPQQAYHFVKPQLQRAKSDRIDARLLCELIQQQSTEPWTPPPTIYHDLYQRLTLRQELQDTRTQYRNRLHALRRNPYAQPTIVTTYEQLLSDLHSQIKQLEKEIEQLLLGDHDWHEAFVYLRSILGINTISAAWILVKTHAFARCDTPEQAVAFAGLAPHERASGQWQGKRYTGGGHARLRSILYLCAGSAIQHNPSLLSTARQTR